MPSSDPGTIPVPAASTGRARPYRGTIPISGDVPESHWKGALCRVGAYALVFVAGAASMSAIGQFIARHRTSSDAIRPAEATTPEPTLARREGPVRAASLAEQLERNEGPTPLKFNEPNPREDSERIRPAASSEGEFPTTLTACGVLEPAAGRYARLPLATNQAVAFIDVKPGDRVKKGWQVFSHWESPERLQASKTELAKTKKLLEVAHLQAVAAEKTAARLRTLVGKVSAQDLQDAETAAGIRRQEYEALQLAVSESESRFAALEFEFGQAFVTSPIEGLVATVDLALGERRQAGGPFRGVVVVDPSVLYCRCLLDSQQVTDLRQLAGPATEPPQPNESADPPQSKLRAVIEAGKRNWPASIVSLGVLADASSGLTAVLLEVENPEGSLHAGERVKVVISHPQSEGPQ